MVEEDKEGHYGEEHTPIVPPPPPPQYPPRTPPPQAGFQRPLTQQPPVYSWQLLHPRERGRILGGKAPKSVFKIIGVLLVITAALEFPVAGLMVYYSTAEGVEFGGTFQLNGTVRADDGVNLSGVRISIIGTSLSAVSTGNGNYTIEDVPNGIWRIRASRAGYRNQTRRVLLYEALSDEVDFRLRAGRGDEEVNDLWFFLSLSIIMTMFSIFVMAGALYAFNGRRFPVVLVGAILGMFTMFPASALFIILPVFILAVVGIFTSTLALVMVIRNRRSFEPWSPGDSDENNEEPV